MASDNGLRGYAVTMATVATGETFTVMTEAADTEQAARQVRAVYGRPGWEVSDVRAVVQDDGS